MCGEFFFLFLVQIWNKFQFSPGYEIFFKTRPFGPATMHGEANIQYPAMHGGGVEMPRGYHLPARADVDPATIHDGLADPAVDHGGFSRKPVSGSCFVLFYPKIKNFLRFLVT